MKYKLLFIVALMSCCLGTVRAEKKDILIIRGASTHGKDAHNNDEVGQLIKDKLEKSKYADQFAVNTTLNYPEDLSLVENADLIIISSDGGAGHALANKEDPTRHTRHLDGVLKKNKTGLMVIHWATDAPSGGMGQLHPENSGMMMDWIGAVYYWVDKAKDPKSSWTWRFQRRAWTSQRRRWRSFSPTLTPRSTRWPGTSSNRLFRLKGPKTIPMQATHP